MESKASILVITTQAGEKEIIQQAFRQHKIRVDSLVTLFDFYVKAHFVEEGPSYRPNHILVDLSMGYQPALDIIFFLKSFSQTRHIPVSVYSEHESECIVQCLEKNGVESLLVKTSSWSVLAGLFVRTHTDLIRNVMVSQQADYSEGIAA